MARTATSAVSLTWQQGSGNRVSRWKKIYRGRTLYYDGGTGRDDQEAYSEATYRFWIDKREIDRNRTPPSKLPGGWDAYDQRIAEQHDRQEALRAATNNWSADLLTAPVSTTAPPETIGNTIRAYLAERRQEVSSGMLRPKSYLRLVQQLQTFSEFAGSRPIGDVSARLLDDYRQHLLGLVEAGRFKQGTAS